MTEVNLKLTFHEDPGHGWVEVPVDLLRALRLSPGDFSECSFISKADGPKVVFLEEDIDAPKFSHHAREAGWKITYETKYTEERFHATVEPGGPNELLGHSAYGAASRIASGVYSRGGSENFFKWKGAGH